MRCVPIRPAEVPPQTKKLPASSQKVDDLKTSESGTEPATPDGLDCSITRVVPFVTPYGSRPTSAGSSRIQRATSGNKLELQGPTSMSRRATQQRRLRPLKAAERLAAQ